MRMLEERKMGRKEKRETPCILALFARQGGGTCQKKDDVETIMRGIGDFHRSSQAKVRSHGEM
jgi:hypothetical protein